jgi:phospholipid/cholesterol/gamma-HCH transport system substrate-binding protein
VFTATSAQKTKVGLFLLAGGALLAAVGLIYAGLNLVGGADRYYVHTADSVSGLKPGAPVEVQGVVVGQVADVELTSGRRDPVTLALDVEEGTPVPVGARAMLRMRGVTGLQYVDISGGDFQGRVRSPGEVIPAVSSSIGQLGDKGLALVDESRKLIVRGTDLVDRIGSVVDDENRAHIAAMLARGERAMAALESAAARIDRTGARLEQLFDGEARQLLAESSGLVGDARRLVQANRTPLGVAIADLREAARSFRRMAETLERDPSRLLFRRRPEARP